MTEINIKPTTIKLPFGLNENNAPVHISDVERGKKCNCVCPSCRSPLIAAKGSKKQPHFKHAVINECEGGIESAFHLAAKKMIMEKKEIKLPKYVSIASATDSRGETYTKSKTVVEDGTVIRFDSLQEEAALYGMKADMLAKKDNKPLIIEIFYRHKVDDQKIEKIKKAKISAIEINLSDLTYVKDWETFWLYINDPLHVQWLYNAKADTISLELEKKVAIKIEMKEKKYKQDEIKKQRQEEKEKEQLLRALDKVKTLSSREYVAQLKQKAETHPVWKYNAQDLPFSWHELPDFVNADIPNGDWIFGCDRRIWQTDFYKSFILRSNDKSFCVMKVDRLLQSRVECKVHSSVRIVGIYGRRYPQLIPDDFYDTLPSSWRSLRTYFNYLCDLGMLEFTGHDYHNPGNDWFRVVSKTPGAAKSNGAFD